MLRVSCGDTTNPQLPMESRVSNPEENVKSTGTAAAAGELREPQSWREAAAGQQQEHSCDPMKEARQGAGNTHGIGNGRSQTTLSPPHATPARLNPAGPSNTERTEAFSCPIPFWMDPQVGCRTGRAKITSGQ